VNREAQAVTKEHPLATLILCYAGMIVIAIAVNLPPVYLTTFEQAFGGADGLTKQQLGSIGTMLFVGLVAGLLAGGPLADRFGARAFVLIGNALIAGGLGLMAVAPSYALLLFATCFMGVGAGVLDMILSPIVAALRPQQRTSAMNLLHAFYAIGTILITLFGSLMIRLSMDWAIFDWRNVCLFLIAVPMTVLLGFAMARVPALVGEQERRTSIFVLLANVSFWAAMFTMMLAGATELGMAQWLPAYAEKALGYEKWTAGQALTAFAVAMAIGRLGGGFISRHIRPIRLLVLCCVLSAALYLVGAFWPERIVALTACVSIGLTVSVLWPTVLGVTADRFPTGGATMFALLAAAGNAGGAMNLVIGGIADRSNLHVAMGAVAVCPAIMVALLLYLGRDHASR